jgi:hypothetical protein
MTVSRIRKSNKVIDLVAALFDQRVHSFGIDAVKGAAHTFWNPTKGSKQTQERVRHPSVTVVESLHLRFRSACCAWLTAVVGVAPTVC